MSVCDRFDMFFVRGKEIRIVPVFDKRVFTVVAAIVDVEVCFWKVWSSCIFNARRSL